MRIASIKGNDLAVVTDKAFILIGDALAQRGALMRGASMIDLITRYDALKSAIAEAAERVTVVQADHTRLDPPVPVPSKIWAAASNYRRGGTGISDTAGRGAATEVSPDALLEMAFLKPPSAVIGPEDAVVIPKDAEAVFPELELCVVIGKKCRNVSVDEAMDAVFGYTIILDMTARTYAAIQAPSALIGTRCVRKGYDTFAPIGPWIATRDEIPNPQGLLAQLWVNGELTQSATTEAMINGVPRLVSYLSRVGTLYPGDLIATGNPDSPEFQRSLAPGDTMRAEIERIGAMNLRVVAASDRG
ncbi:MAG TPA: fumarylacetoacetate hydrolase family protein [Chloroflexota bacterium]|nr:fumarylacetoacetate hydrolase family protein [Chloroflexota bacterium]